MKGAKKADTAEAQHHSARGGGGKHLGIVGAAMRSATYMIRQRVLVTYCVFFKINITWLRGS